MWVILIVEKTDKKDRKYREAIAQLWNANIIAKYKEIMWLSPETLKSFITTKFKFNLFEEKSIKLGIDLYSKFVSTQLSFIETLYLFNIYVFGGVYSLLYG